LLGELSDTREELRMAHAYLPMSDDAITENAEEIARLRKLLSAAKRSTTLHFFYARLSLVLRIFLCK
jgi:hypothetical protein